jgi:hypothetical protein
MEGYLKSILGDPVTDPEEGMVLNLSSIGLGKCHCSLRHTDAFLVFSQDIPSHALGFIVTKAATVELTVAGRDLSIKTSRGLLTSNRSQGTTGAGQHCLRLQRLAF